MRNLQRLIAAAALVACVVTAFADVKSASAVLSSAQTKARLEKKNVLVMFDASWCGWCRRLEKFVEDKEMRKLLEKSFVLVTLDVLENEDKKALENPGGSEYLEKFGGKDAGLPFTAAIDPSGKLIVNSNEKDGKKGNIGYPAAPNEIAHFMTMLKKSAPQLSNADREKLRAWLVANAPKT
ncbi:MAG: thioredoxin family protein [Fimbriimonas sp.]